MQSLKECSALSEELALQSEEADGRGRATSLFDEIMSSPDEMKVVAAAGENYKRDVSTTPTRFLQSQDLAQNTRNVGIDSADSAEDSSASRPIRKGDRSAAREYFYMTITAINMMQLEDGLDMCPKHKEKQLWGDARTRTKLTVSAS